MRGARARLASPNVETAPLQAITSMVQECMTFLDATPDLDTKVALIKTLVTVSAGKARRASCRLAALALTRPSPADLRGG